jgi:hypothetical protein
MVVHDVMLFYVAHRVDGLLLQADPHVIDGQFRLGAVIDDQGSAVLDHDRPTPSLQARFSGGGLGGEPVLP